MRLKRQRLNQACRQIIEQGYAVGTRINHEVHKKSYLRFCSEYQFDPFPADDWHYCQYAQHLAWEDKVPETINNYVSSVKTFHKLQKYQVPEPGQIHFKLLTEGLKKLCIRLVKHAQPINHNILYSIFLKVDLTSELEAVAWVAVLVGFTMVLRVLNLGPYTRDTFDP